MKFKGFFKSISIAILLMTAISCSSLFSKKNEANVLIGRWEGKWDDIVVQLEFKSNNKGALSYSNPAKKMIFDYKIQVDSVFLRYPTESAVKSYKFDVNDDKLFLHSKEAKEEFTEIIELITYTRKKE